MAAFDALEVAAACGSGVRSLWGRPLVALRRDVEGEPGHLAFALLDRTGENPRGASLSSRSARPVNRAARLERRSMGTALAGAPNMDTTTWTKFIEELRVRRWSERDGFRFAPEGSLWFSIATPWHTSFEEFREQMFARLERCRRAMTAFAEETIWQATVRDHESLVEALEASEAAP